MPSAHFQRERWQTRLAIRARDGDQRARETLVRELLPVARRVAHRFASTQHPVDDLAQVAGIGLLKAIERFDPAREAAFTTYAHALMTGEIQRHVRDARLVRIPRSIYEQVPAFLRAHERLGAELGRSPSRSELADALWITKEELIELADAALTASPLSLDAETDDGMAPWDATTHEYGFDQVEAGAALAPMLRRLSRRERMVLDLRFEDGLSQSEIAAGLGLSQTQVSRILRRALGKLSDAAFAAA